MLFTWESLNNEYRVVVFLACAWIWKLHCSPSLHFLRCVFALTHVIVTLLMRDVNCKGYSNLSLPTVLVVIKFLIPLFVVFVMLFLNILNVLLVVAHQGLSNKQTQLWRRNVFVLPQHVPWWFFSAVYLGIYVVSSVK